MFLGKLAACLTLVCLLAGPAQALVQEQIFSNAYYHDEDKQCAAIARFTVAAVKRKQIQSDFMGEWSKRSIEKVNGAFIDSAVDKDLYTYMAVRAESEVDRMGVNNIPPSDQSIQLDCKKRFESILKSLNDNRSEEVEQARASLKLPTSPELILGERDYKNINDACISSTRNTHADVLMALRSTKTHYEAKQWYYGKPHSYDLMYGRTPLDNPKFRFLPGLHRFQILIKNINRKYEDQLFAGNDDKVLSDDLTKECIKSSTDFWIQYL